MTSISPTPLADSGTPSESGVRNFEFPVLIRLPDLQTVRSDSIEPFAGGQPETAAAAGAGSEPGARCPGVAANEEKSRNQHSKRPSDAVEATPGGTGIPSPRAMVSWPLRRLRRGRRQLQTWWKVRRLPSRLPRPVLHAGIALAAICLVVACVLLIGGGDPGEEPAAKMPSDLAERENLPLTEDSLNVSTLPLLPTAPRELEDPQPRYRGPIELPSAPPMPPSEKDAEAELAATPQPPGSPAKSESPGDSNDRTLQNAEEQLAGEPEVKAETESARATPEPADPPPADLAASAEPASDATTAEPEQPAEEERSGEAGAGAEKLAITYPTTDPANFQFPADYHLRLLSTQQPPVPNQSGWPQDADRYQWPANTARLQPRIEPPPIR